MPTHPSVQIAGPVQPMPQQQQQQQAQEPPPVGMGAPPADYGIPDSHDIVQVPQSPHARGRGYGAPPPPAMVMPMSQEPFEATSGTGYAVEMEGF
jgi:hypothetical protein